MTALKPIENRRVRGVAAERYPSNLICAHPDCDKAVDLRPSGEPTVHHVFPRSLTKSDSYFVEITEDAPPEVDAGGDFVMTSIVPHAVGLCGSGTTGHHGDIEEHRAWIKLEDGEYVWYDRGEEQRWDCTGVAWDQGARPPEDGLGEWEPHLDYFRRTAWVAVGPLNPQPGSVDGKPKRKRTVRGTSARAERKTVSVRLPEGTSGEDWDELLDEAGKVELSQSDTQFDPAKGDITVGKLLVTLLERFTGRNG